VDPPQVTIKDTDACPGSAQMRATFNAIEYSEADVPIIILERPRRLEYNFNY